MPGYRHFASNVLRSLVLAACISLLGSLAISLPAAAAPFPARSSVQQGRGEGQYIAVDVDLVVFNVAVTDGKGRHVSGLAYDFYVYKENRLQDKSSFSRPKISLPPSGLSQPQAIAPR